MSERTIGIGLYGTKVRDVRLDSRYAQLNGSNRLNTRPSAWSQANTYWRKSRARSASRSWSAS